MPEAIPSILAPYLQECFSDTSLTLVTSTLSTPSTWLLIRLLYVALSGAKGTGPGYGGHHESSDTTLNVIFVSLLRPTSLWLELGRKLGVDLASLFKDGRLKYIDGLTSDGQGSNNAPIQCTRLKSLRLENLAPAINSQLQSQVSAETLTRTRAPTKTIVIIDGLDFLLASEADLEAVKIQQFISSVRSESHAVILTCSADSPLLHNRHDAATPLEHEHTNFVTAFAYQSSWVMQLRGLDTGAAKDVTGVLRVSIGGSYDEDSAKSRLEEGEWLYQLKGDGSVRVWSRGQ